jgi:hypothetical protein
MLVQWVDSIAELGSEGAFFHFFEANGQDAIGDSTRDKLMGEEKSTAPGGAIVVHVIYGNA